MTATLPAPLTPLPELESRADDVGRLVTEIRRLASDVAAVQATAEVRSADAAGWAGDAGEAADHEATRFSRALAAPEAALFSAAGAAEVFELALTTLQGERDDLEWERTGLNQDISETAARIAASGLALGDVLSGNAMVAAALRQRVGDAMRRMVAWVQRVEEAEATFIRALAMVDTTEEASRAVADVKAQEAAGQQVRDVVDDLIAAGVVPAVVRGMNAARLRDYLTAHPEVARRIVANRPRPDADGLEGLLAAGMGSAAVGKLFASMRESDARVLAQLYPDEIGNRSGAPFTYRAEANRVRILDQIERIDAQDADEFSQRRAEIRRTYQSLLDRDGDVVVFDPSNGAIAEVHGRLDAGTKNVGVVVPGTFADPTNFGDLAARSESFARAQADGSLATVSWMGGEFPPDLVAAGSSRYADDLGPRLADFSRDLRQELDLAGASDAHTTYVGHSYGGAVVGTAELSGLDADRVLHLESAGMGKGVDDPGDLPESQWQVRRFSMTAPGDLIGSFQGVPWAHGADPDEFDGTTHLDTGRYADGSKVSGYASHSRVFDPGSDPWKQTFEVMTGGTVRTHIPVLPLGPGGPPPPSGRPPVGGELIDLP